MLKLIHCQPDRTYFHPLPPVDLPHVNPYIPAEPVQHISHDNF